jgi:hypothetical protein
LPGLRSVVFLQSADRLQLRLEEELVDLALVDRDAFLEADTDHLRAIDPELLRQLFRREVIRHDAPSSTETKKPTGAQLSLTLGRWAR